jgi:hypothetical protein
VLAGNLSSTTVADVLRQVAAVGGDGCLHLAGEGNAARVFFRSGRICHASALGRHVQLGARLLSAGRLTPEALDEALEIQRTELRGWRLGDLLVHLGVIRRGELEGFVREQILDAVFDVLRWTDGTWRFAEGERSDQDIGVHIGVEDLLEQGARRLEEWHEITARIPGPDALVRFANSEASSVQLALSPDEWALLCRVDGRRPVAALARDAGYNEFEAARILHGLVASGLLEVDRPAAQEPLQPDREAAGASAATDLEDAGGEPTPEGWVTADVQVGDGLEGAAAVAAGGDAAPQVVGEAEADVGPWLDLEPDDAGGIAAALSGLAETLGLADDRGDASSPRLEAVSLLREYVADEPDPDDGPAAAPPTPQRPVPPKDRTGGAGTRAEGTRQGADRGQGSAGPGAGRPERPGTEPLDPGTGGPEQRQRPAQDVDQSALLREFASLTMDDDEPGQAQPAAPPRPPAPPPAPAAPQHDDRSKGGLFGFRRGGRR